MTGEWAGCGCPPGGGAGPKATHLLSWKETRFPTCYASFPLLPFSALRLRSFLLHVYLKGLAFHFNLKLSNTALN